MKLSRALAGRTREATLAAPDEPEALELMAELSGSRKRA